MTCDDCYKIVGDNILSFISREEQKDNLKTYGLFIDFKCDVWCIS